ncbi:related to vesicular transport-associated repeat protein Tb-291 [Phialocephala subalpina]|uniref:Related to vesicular transport-associated repeat protein Tb-291 n=1 Tax=Phialocephala subalpina TaxID=576137 RepID=A0A1L7X208_9HELO|nr:related to vesicular transport-associated repeat protein Tb-291 [Phialocephala subalpina]
MDLEKELTCSICTEVLYQPLTLLDCLHTFCGSCLKEWFSWQLTSARNNPNSLPAGSTPYTCPSCRAPVRDTKHNATVTTLVDMIVAASPEKGKSDEEKEELKSKYAPGENVLPKVEEREKTLRERRVEDADRRLMNEVRDLSLREVGVESPEARRERRRREESRSQGTRAPRSRDPSRDSRSTDERDRERRRRREAERQGSGSNGALQPEPESTDDRRRRRSAERRSRNDEPTRTAARQIEHQSSLRSLISASDVDSREMEEEILRQIREEGLLDGIDLENIDVSEQDQISERIAEAFRRRQSERARQEPARRSNTSATSAISTVSAVSTAGAVGGEQRRRRTHSSAPDSREHSGDDSVRPSSRRQRAHSRSPSSASQDQPSRPPQSMSAVQAAHLEVQSGDEGRHRRRRTGSSSRSATTPTPVAETLARPAARSQTDLSNRPQSAILTSTRPSVSASARSTTDPIVAQAAELPAPQSRSRASSNSSPRLRSAARMEDSTISTAMTERRTRAPPENIFVPVAGPSVISSPTTDQSLMPAPLSPRNPPHSGSLSDRAHALSSGSRPTSSGSIASRNRLQLYPEPSITCNRCAKPHIEYELHYNCGICHNGNWNICLSCYRSGAGCLHWFGFGQAAWAKWEKLSQGGEPIERPHMLTGSRYLPPKIIPGGAEGRRTLTTDDPQKRLQSGTFCASCLAWTNECYWRCDLCNEGDWGFCNVCVNQGNSCSHPLLPLTYKPAETNTPPLSPTHDHRTPASASILTGPGVMDIGPFKPLTFSTKCDNCHHPIQPSQSRYHCFSCVSKVPDTLPGDYDVCTTCYSNLIKARRISAENGQNGWRRCLQGHRMIIIGFEDNRGGQRRVIVQDLVGGRGLSEQPSTHTDHSGTELQKWSWGDGVHIRGDDTHMKLVTKDVMKTAPSSSPELVLDAAFPPDGGVGMLAVALWPWWPTPDADDELMFPKGAEVKECKNVNDDWWHGTYMGKRGLFPAPYVKTLDKI